MSAPPKPWERQGDVNHRQYPYQPDNTPSFISTTPQFIPGSGGGGSMAPSVRPPPLPPRPNTSMNSSPYNTYPRSPYSSYGNMGMYGSGMYGRTYRGYGQYGMNTYPDEPDGNGFIQIAEDSSRQAFQSIESIVHAFGSVSMMLESTYHAVYSTFRAVLGVADHFNRMKSHFAQIFSALAIVRTLRWLYHRLLYLIGLRSQDPSLESVWRNSNGSLPNASQITESDLKASKSSWPIMLFLGVVFGGPYLIWRLLSSLVPPKSKSMGWIKGQEEHYAAVGQFPFQAKMRNELSFSSGQQLIIAPKDQQPSIQGWLLASNGANVGLVPANYVKVLGLRSPQSHQQPQQGNQVVASRIPNMPSSQHSARQAMPLQYNARPGMPSLQQRPHPPVSQSGAPPTPWLRPPLTTSPGPQPQWRGTPPTTQQGAPVTTQQGAPLTTQQGAPLTTQQGAPLTTQQGALTTQRGVPSFTPQRPPFTQHGVTLATPQGPVTTQQGVPLTTQQETLTTQQGVLLTTQQGPLSTQQGVPLATRQRALTTQQEDPPLLPLTTQQQNPPPPLTTQQQDPPPPLTTQQQNPPLPLTSQQNPPPPPSTTQEDPPSPLTTQQQDPLPSPLTTQQQDPLPPPLTTQQNPPPPSTTQQDPPPPPHPPLTTQQDPPPPPLTTQQSPLPPQQQNPLPPPLTTQQQNPPLPLPLTTQHNPPPTFTQQEGPPLLPPNTQQKLTEEFQETTKNLSSPPPLTEEDMSPVNQDSVSPAVDNASPSVPKEADVDVSQRTSQSIDGGDFSTDKFDKTVKDDD